MRQKSCSNLNRMKQIVQFGNTIAGFAFVQLQANYGKPSKVVAGGGEVWYGMVLRLGL